MLDGPMIGASSYGESYMEIKHYLKLKNDIYGIMNVVLAASVDIASKGIDREYMQKYWTGYRMNDEVSMLIEAIIKECGDE